MVLRRGDLIVDDDAFIGLVRNVERGRAHLYWSPSVPTPRLYVPSHPTPRCGWYKVDGVDRLPPEDLQGIDPTSDVFRSRLDAYNRQRALELLTPGPTPFGRWGNYLAAMRSAQQRLMGDPRPEGGRRLADEPRFLRGGGGTSPIGWKERWQLLQTACEGVWFVEGQDLDDPLSAGSSSEGDDPTEDLHQRQSHILPPRLTRGLHALRFQVPIPVTRAWKQTWDITFWRSGDAHGTPWNTEDDWQNPPDQDLFSRLGRSGFLSPLEWKNLTSHLGTRTHQQLFYRSVDLKRPDEPVPPDAQPHNAAFQPYFPHDQQDVPRAPSDIIDYISRSPLETAIQAIETVLRTTWEEWKIVAVELPVMNPWTIYKRPQGTDFVLETRVDFVAKTRDTHVVGDYKMLLGKGDHRKKVVKRRDLIQLVVNAFLLFVNYGVLAQELVLVYSTPTGHVYCARTPFQLQHPFVQSVITQLILPPNGGIYLDTHYVIRLHKGKTVPPGLPALQYLWWMNGLTPPQEPPVVLYTNQWSREGEASLGRHTVLRLKHDRTVIFLWEDPQERHQIEEDTPARGKLPFRTTLPLPVSRRCYDVLEPHDVRLLRLELCRWVENEVISIVYQEHLTQKEENGRYYELDPSHLLSLFVDAALDVPAPNNPPITEESTNRRLTRYQKQRLNADIIRRTLHRVVNKHIQDRFPQVLERHQNFIHLSQRGWWTRETLQEAIKKGSMKAVNGVRRALKADQEEE